MSHNIPPNPLWYFTEVTNTTKLIAENSRFADYDYTLGELTYRVSVPKKIIKKVNNLLYFHTSIFNSILKKSQLTLTSPTPVNQNKGFHFNYRKNRYWVHKSCQYYYASDRTIDYLLDTNKPVLDSIELLWETDVKSGFTIYIESEDANTFVGSVSLCNDTEVFVESRGLSIAKVRHQRRFPEDDKYLFTIKHNLENITSLSVENLLQDVLGDLEILKDKIPPGTLIGF